MHSSTLLVILLGLMGLAYHFGRRRAITTAGGVARINTLHSLPGYYGFYAALWAGIPAFLILGLWTGFQNEILMAIVTAELSPEAVAGTAPGLLVSSIKNLAAGVMASGGRRPSCRPPPSAMCVCNRSPNGASG